MRLFFILLCGLLWLVPLPPALAASPEALSEDSAAAPSLREKLPLPRFASLRASEVNMRTGPGTRYPIIWVYKRDNWPVEITAELDNWRRVREMDGTEGWVHQQMLSGRRYVLVRDLIRTLRNRPAEDSALLARLSPGVLAELKRCQGQWCRIETASHEGWVRRDEIWGVYPHEEID